MLQAADGNFKQAFESSLLMRKIASHIENNGMLCYSSFLMDANALNCIGLLLGYVDLDTEMLSWLKNKINENPITITFDTDVFWEEYDLTLDLIRSNPEFIDNLLHAKQLKGNLDELVQKKDSQSDPNIDKTQKITDEELLNLAGEPYEKYLDSVVKVIESDFSYHKKCSEIQALSADIDNEFVYFEDVSMSNIIANPERLLTFAIVMNRSDPLYRYRIQFTTTSHFRAYQVAIEVYLVKARTGQLPEELPEGLPKDPYSGEDFEYEITDDGFTLRCREKDFEYKNVHEYEFKVKNKE
jgi:hypothetical protein